MTPFPYRVVVRWSEPDGAYVAEVPAVSGAGGDGATAEVALRAAQDSVLELIELKKQHGDPVPPPDIEDPKFSGQLRLRMPPSLHRQLAAEADREGVSLNQLMVTYLSIQMGRQSVSTALLPSWTFVRSQTLRAHPTNVLTSITGTQVIRPEREGVTSASTVGSVQRFRQ